jgi:DNA polymerase III subunit beta
MKLKILQENLNNSLIHLTKAIPNKPQLPILSSVLIENTKEQCVISATDLYFGVRCIIQVDSEKEGVTVVPGKQLKEIISSLNPGVLDLFFEKGKLTLKSDKTSTSLSCMSSDDFPPFPQVEGEEYVMSLTDLEKIDKNVGFSASTDQARPVLTSILFIFTEDNLKVVSTDGFRLATLDMAGFKKQEVGEFLIPAKALSEVYRIADRVEAKEVRFKVSQELKQVLFSIDSVEVFVRLIEGEYPPYEKIIPTEFTTSVIFDTEELHENLKRAMIFARESSNIVRFVIDKKIVKIHSSSPSFGSYEGELHNIVVDGEKNEIAFNIKYLLDYLGSVKTEKLIFSMSESLRPALFRPEDDKNYKYVVMPFKVNS